MKPAVFSYERATSVSHALAVLQEHGSEVKILAGGQSLVPAMNFRLARPDMLLDINALHELSYIRVTDEAVHVGALTRHASVEDDPRVPSVCPLLAKAIRHVAHRSIRNRGTVGGSVAHADPSSELPAVLSALGGSMRLLSATGERFVSADEFFVSIMMTALEPEELLAELMFPRLAPSAGCSFQEVARRPGDFAIVGVAAWVMLDPNQILQAGSFATTGVSGTPANGSAALMAARGQRFSAEVAEAVAADFVRELDPDSDVHATAAFRRHLAQVLVARALTEAAGRSGTSPHGGREG